MKRHLCIAAAAALLIALAGCSSAGTGDDDPNREWLFSAKVIADDGDTYDYFGGSAAVSGDYIIVGASEADGFIAETGVAYVYRRAGTDMWTQDAKLTASDVAAFDGFGDAVAIDGDYAVVGASYHDVRGSNSVGAVYVFHRDNDAGWTLDQKLTASDGEANDNFGGSVAIDGDTVVVGATGDDDAAIGAGAAYIFRREDTIGWSEEAKITPSNGDDYDRFGNSVAISDDTAIIGASGDDDTGIDAGAAYIFGRDDTGGWTENAKIIASDSDSGDFFGWPVAISGDYAIVGATGDDVNGTDNGSAYVFRRTEAAAWVQDAKLTAFDGIDYHNFGASVAVSEDYAVVGANEDGTTGYSSGATYLFRRAGASSWRLETKLTAPDGSDYHYFGSSAAIDADSVIVGADGSDGGVDETARYTSGVIANGAP